MSGPAIIAKDVTVAFRPFVERTPTLRRRFGRPPRREQQVVQALDGVSVTVEQGEALAVIGENGAGKTTLMRALAGTLQPASGLVEWRTEPPTLLELGVGFNAALSGRNNVMLGGLAAGQSRAKMESLYDEIVEFSGIADAIDRPVNTYSSGMRARLSFAIAMTLKPKVVLLDELLTVGDASFKARSTQAMNELLEGAGTMVLVSHSMARVRDQCDRALWLDRGRVKMLDEAGAVVDAYLEHVGSPPVKLVEKPLADWDGQDRTKVVKRLLKGEALPAVSAATGIDIDTLKDWRRTFLRAGRRALQRKRLEDDE